MASNNLILKLHTSRVNLLKQCESLGYDVSEHLDTSNLEVDKLYVNNKLDMIIENNEKRKYTSNILILRIKRTIRLQRKI